MSPTKPHFFSVHENILVYAFRYALGRRTGAVSDVIRHLETDWSRLQDHTKLQMIEEMKTVIRLDKTGDSYAVEEWQRLLDFVTRKPPSSCS